MSADLGHPDDNGGFWSGVVGAFDGVSKVVSTLDGISESGANIAGNIASGQQSLLDVRQDRKAESERLALERLKVERGDNLHMYYAAAAGAAALAYVVMKG